MVRTLARTTIAFLLLLAVCAAATDVKSPYIGVQVTTRSPQARAYFEQGLAKYQTLHLQVGLATWRKAVQADPQFALAHIFLANFSDDPVEQVSEREKALASKKSASKEEQLIIDWLSNSSKGQWIPAIQAMNEVRTKYPQDKQVLWLSGNWLTGQQQWARAIQPYEKATKLDPNFADAWNSLAYCYARTRQFDRAFAAMKRYTELLPNESNPQDSFAEISRMAGRYEDALVHYHESLKIDSSFIESQLGIGDTYALMGDEARARKEYAVAIEKAVSKLQKASWSLQSAATYVREGDYAGADAAYLAVAKQAHENDLGNIEAEAFRQMSMYQKDSAAAADALNKAEGALHENHQVPKSLLDQEMASILNTRVQRAVNDGNLEAAAAALKQLEEIAATSSDDAVLLFLASASGAVSIAQGKYQEAVTLLQDADRDPFAMLHLVQAYDKLGQKDNAERISRNLAEFNEPVIEQALVVLPFRKAQKMSAAK
jgi:tetratricopeptide (TPR) repeat protein